MKICLDAGHYGKYNRSPVNGSYYESDMTWKLHTFLKSALEAYGITVITTRKNQASDLALEARGKTAKGCDLFISVHSNACGTESVDYPLACCCVSGKVDTIGKKLADTVASVMGTRQSGRIIKKRGDSGDWYGVLRGAAKVGVPGVLLEHSFHTNAKATAWLLSDSHLKKLAEAEAQTIAEHYGIKKASQSVPTAAPESGGQKSPSSYMVKIICDALNVRSAPGLSSQVKSVVHKGEAFTIVETKSIGSVQWGKLKSGAGWISLGEKYVKRI